jgi:putative transposase
VKHGYHLSAYEKRLLLSHLRHGLSLKAYESIPEARRELAAYFDFYNRRRRHQGLGNRTPDDYY